MKIREYLPSDSQELAKLFYETIHSVNAQDYNEAQLNAWAPRNRDAREWERSFENKWVFIAEEGNNIAGFGELEVSGHIDRFYISRDFISQGVGRKIYNAIENGANNQRIKRLFVEASITARSFFEKMGFKIIKEQIVELRAVNFTNYSMEKILDV